MLAEESITKAAELDQEKAGLRLMEWDLGHPQQERTNKSSKVEAPQAGSHIGGIALFLISAIKVGKIF